MKRLIAAVACLTLCIACLGNGKERNTWHRMAGIDLGAAIGEGAMKIVISQQFAKHWSIDSRHSVRMNMSRHRLSSEEKEHYEILDYAFEDAGCTDEDIMTGDITISYWINESFRGLSLQAGCSWGIRKNTESILGLGYTIGIWKGLRCSMTYYATLGCQMNRNFGFTITYVMK